LINKNLFFIPKIKSCVAYNLEISVTEDKGTVLMKVLI